LKFTDSALAVLWLGYSKSLEPNLAKQAIKDIFRFCSAWHTKYGFFAQMAG
jgi:hypothetical protein